MTRFLKEGIIINVNGNVCVKRCEGGGEMIKAVLFDLGGTLHTGSSPEGRDIWFASRIIGRLADYGILLGAAPE